MGNRFKDHPEQEMIFPKMVSFADASGRSSKVNNARIGSFNEIIFVGIVINLSNDVIECFLIECFDLHSSFRDLQIFFSPVVFCSPRVKKRGI